MDFSMKTEDLNQKNNQQKSSDSSEDPVKEVEKKRGSLLNRLIFIVCCSIIGFVGINFVACNFMIPGTINKANVLGGLKNPPPLDCKESERRGYETLLAILTTVIALRTKVEED
jgi:hypothetical protein